MGSQWEIWEDIGLGLSISWGYLQDTLGIFGRYLGDILGIFGGYIRDILGISPGYLREAITLKKRNFIKKKYHKPGSDGFPQEILGIYWGYVGGVWEVKTVWHFAYIHRLSAKSAKAGVKKTMSWLSSPFLQFNLIFSYLLFFFFKIFHQAREVSCSKQSVCYASIFLVLLYFSCCYSGETYL